MVEMSLGPAGNICYFDPKIESSRVSSLRSSLRLVATCQETTSNICYEIMKTHAYNKHIFSVFFKDSLGKNMQKPKIDQNMDLLLWVELV